MSEKRDYYEVLSVAKTVSTDEIRKAYKREALKHHPDRNPGDKAAEAKFKECTEAYSVLSDEEKRRVYDQFGHAFRGAPGGGGGGPQGQPFDFTGQPGQIDLSDLFGAGGVDLGSLFGGGGCAVAAHGGKDEGLHARVF